MINLIIYYNVYHSIYIKFYYYYNPTKSINCYNIKENTLEDITNVKPQPKLDESIFFHETSCTSFFNNKITITARQACAIESAARLNPNHNVYLLITSPGLIQYDENSESDRILHALTQYDNVNIYHLDFETYTKGSPVEHLFNGILQQSHYAQSHASDILRFVVFYYFATITVTSSRYLTLWKYGGIYLDLDVIVIKSLENLKSENYAGAESSRNVAAGVIRFSSSGIGHQMAEECLNDLKVNFNGNEWGSNGPGVVTRLLKRKCRAKQAKDMTNNPNCRDDFTVYPPETFYTIPWWNWTMFFNQHSINDVENMTKNSFVIHVWNKHSAGTKININSNVPYKLYAEKYCPRIFEQCTKYF